jgi:hypothetical protein
VCLFAYYELAFLLIESLIHCIYLYWESGILHFLTLALLKARVFLVDHIELALAANDFAIDTAFLDGGPDFHILPFYALFAVSCSVAVLMSIYT